MTVYREVEPIYMQRLSICKTFSNDLIKIIGVINNRVECNDWTAKNVKVTVVENGHRPIFGRDLFPQLRLSLTQSKQLLNTDQNHSSIKQQLALDYPFLISRGAKSQRHTV